MGLLDCVTGRISKTKDFRKQCDAAFDEVDHDGSGTLSTTELHLVVLMFFDKINAKMSNKHVSPPGKSEVFELFWKSDTDRSGELSKDEFHALMAELCKHVSNGIAMDLLKGLVLVPALVALVNRGLEKKLPKVHKQLVDSGGLGAAVLSTAAVVAVNKIPFVNNSNPFGANSAPAINKKK